MEKIEEILKEYSEKRKEYNEFMKKFYTFSDFSARNPEWRVMKICEAETKLEMEKRGKNNNKTVEMLTDTLNRVKCEDIAHDLMEKIIPNIKNSITSNNCKAECEYIYGHDDPRRKMLDKLCYTVSGFIYSFSNEYIKFSTDCQTGDPNNDFDYYGTPFIFKIKWEFL